MKWKTSHNKPTRGIMTDKEREERRREMDVRPDRKWWGGRRFYRVKTFGQKRGSR